jgi:uncharacterized protein YbjT (DUF2867 family)
VEATANYAQAAAEVKAEFIVNMSQRTSRPDAPSNSALNHWLAERIFDWAPTPVTHLRPTAFNEWVFYVRQGIIEGRYPALRADGSLCPDRRRGTGACDRRDPG